MLHRKEEQENVKISEIKKQQHYKTLHVLTLCKTPNKEQRV